MTGTLRVTPEKLASAADAFSQSATQVKRATDEMQGIVHSLDRAWRAEAASAYIRKFNSLDKSMTRLYRMIEEHSKDLKQMAQNYTKAEEGNIASFSALNAGILSGAGGGGIGAWSAEGAANGKTGTSASAGWLGYEVDQDHPGVTSWIGKAHAETNGDWGNAEVNAYAGKFHAETTFEAGLMQAKREWKYENGEWTEEESLSILYAEAGLGASFSALAIDGDLNTGNDLLGFDMDGEGSAGNVKFGGKGNLSIGTDGIEATLEGEALVSAVEGEASASFNFLGLEITGKVGGYAGALGVEGKVGLEDNKFVLEGGVAAALGVSVGVEIGFNDTGWKNFVDFITFWD